MCLCAYVSMCGINKARVEERKRGYRWMYVYVPRRRVCSHAHTHAYRHTSMHTMHADTYLPHHPSNSSLTHHSYRTLHLSTAHVYTQVTTTYPGLFYFSFVGTCARHRSSTAATADPAMATAAGGAAATQGEER